MDLHSKQRPGAACSSLHSLAMLIGRLCCPAFALVCLSAMLPGGTTQGQPTLPPPERSQPLFSTPALMDRPRQLIISNGVFSSIPTLPMLSGPIYPSSAFPGTFEVDAPLETGPMAPNREARYFAFRLVFRYIQDTQILFAWQVGEEPEIPFQVITGPCGEAFTDERWRTMADASIEWTGRGGPAAYDGFTRALLGTGRPLTWASCEPNDRVSNIQAPQQGPFTRQRGYQFRRFVFLIPDQVLQGGGRLLARMQERDGSLSEPAAVPVRRAGVSVGVIGDSVAWGQGVMEPQKAGFQIYLGLINARLIPSNSRYFNVAHSGAQIRIGNSNTIADVTDEECERDANLHGEVPRARPSIQCQVRRLAQRSCRVANNEPGTVAVPRFYCDNDSCAPTEDFTEYKFDEGLRWDIVVATGCINDIGAPDIVLGTNLASSTGALRDAVADRCNLRNGLRDLRRWLPNAQIMFMQYHRPVTSNSDLRNTGCASGFVQDLSEAVLQQFPILRGMAAATVNGAATRSSVFQQRSFIAQTAAAEAMNTDFGDIGRGMIRMVDMSDLFTQVTGFMAPANATRLWPLACTGGQVLLPMDTERGSRPGPCSAFFNPDGDRPHNPAEESCLRASAFHPDATANTQMAVRIRRVLNNAGLFPPPF